MALTTCTDDLAIIAALDDAPNDTGGLTAAQFKAKFDDGAEALQTYINDTHIPELDAEHLPYIYGSATTIKGAMEGLVAGVVPDDSIDADMLKSDAVTTAKIADGNVTEAKIAPAIRPFIGAWEQLQAYTAAASGNWTAPDEFDGEDYEVGVFIIGGGGSGGAAQHAAIDTYRFAVASGGAAGYTRTVLMTVTPGASYAYVVGAGGAAVSVSTNTTATGNTGGTSSFDSKTATGGAGGKGAQNGSSGALVVVVDGADGGQGSDGLYCASAALKTAPSMGAAASSLGPGNTYVGVPGRSTPNMCVNPFTMQRLLGAGGGAGAQNNGATNAGYSQTVPTLDDGYVAGAGLGATTPGGTASSATSTGCGGGGVASVGSSNGAITSGAGADGAIYIYKRSVS